MCELSTGQAGRGKQVARISRAGIGSNALLSRHHFDEARYQIAVRRAHVRRSGAAALIITQG